MRIGLALPHYPFSFPAGTPDAPLPQRSLQYAAAAEELGFHQLWVSDHLWIDVAPLDSPPQHHAPAECWTLLAALAATTRTIRLGSLVTPVGLRNPHLLARIVDTVHQLCGRRLDIGLGAGWNADEFTRHGLHFAPAPHRLAALADTVRLLKTMPNPPPLWVGGKRPKLMAVAATADGWNTAWNCTVAEYARRAAELKAICVANGRDPAALRRSLGLITLIGHDNDDLVARWQRLQRWAPGGALDHVTLKHWAGSRLVGTPPQIRKQIRQWADHGVEQLICSLGMPFAIHDDEQLTLLAEVASGPES